MATRTISNAGGNWSAVGTWVEGAVPKNADNVVATATSGNLVLNTNCDCSTMDLTGYAGTMSDSGGTLRIFGGSIIFGGTITATSTLQLFTVAPTITSNGITWTGSISFPSVITTTISGTLTVGGNLTLSNGNINGDSISFGGNLTTAGNQIGAPTSTLIANGTGDQTWSGNFVFRQPLTINKASGNFIVSGGVSKSTGTLTYTAGTVVTTGSTLTIVASTTLDTNGITWNNITFTGVFTITNNSLLRVDGLFSYGMAIITLNGSDVILNGGFTNNSNSASAGTATFKFQNTGTWVHTSGGSIGNNIVFDSGVNTITIGSIVRYATGTITYTSGTVDTATNNSTLSISTVGSCTLNTNGMTWNNVILVGSITLTINSLLTINGTLDLGTFSQTFTGTHGWNTNNLITQTIVSSRNQTLKSGLSYTINNSFISIGNTNTIRTTFRSSIGGSQAILTLGTSATQNLKFVNATDIDSSLGQTINSNKGTLINATNWYRTNGTFMYLMAS